MKKVLLTTMGLLALLKSFTQQQPDSVGRKLRIEEINLVSSYYQQSGDHAGVTGGVGTQRLTDVANVFDLKLAKFDKKNRKHMLDLELAVDHYTSASSDMIDLKANSSASYNDTRIAPAITYSVEHDAAGRGFSLGVSASKEVDYRSHGVNIGFTKKTKDRNGEFSARLQAYFDEVKLIAPIELREPGAFKGYPTDQRTTFAGSFSWSQVINRNLQVMLLADVVKQEGYLSMPFYRVYFNDGSVHQENLPSSRFKLPLAVRANYFLGDRVIVRSYYRYYQDDWGVRSHTANVELPVKLTPFVSISPFYRYYHQSAVDYFAPYGEHSGAGTYYTSNYDLSAFDSHFLGAGIRLAPPKGVLGWQHFNMLELRYGHYTRSNDLNANSVSLHIRFK
ncbi:DUF3570 domain-containing protein [Paraflavitalea sp. CAU 1676]|uniref:DUF3570 domain-containing protein n=1 Tax=Paraflavitalea sp. CAU 1676 TaxID=3032598 RepID=UPI0023DBC024|nr:DUF3570 domain-containing protein [Paraflavitalea sp. CAU 1676]MDF2192785.1 DUF3570 domain-containing protein [Paraflavitalea sp. CAU 1676]